MNFHLVTPVWGESYTDLFLTVTLPDFLSEGNVPALCAAAGARFKIYTAAGERATIEAAPAFAAIARHIPVDFIGLDQFTGAQKYETLIRCHAHAAEAAHRDNAALIILPPDQIYNDGAFAALARLSAAGKKVVFTASFRVARETFVPAALRSFAAGAAPALHAPARDLVRCAMDNFHPITQSLFWHQPLNSIPAHIYWRVGGQGFIAHGFHLHPLLIDNRGMPFTPPAGTVDGAYVEYLPLRPEHIHIVLDSDEIIACEISATAPCGAIPARAFNFIHTVLWARRGASPYQRTLFEHKIRFHTGDITGSEWARAERASDSITRALLGFLKTGRAARAALRRIAGKR